MTPTDQPKDESTFATRRAEQTARAEQSRADLSADRKVGGTVTDPGADDLDGPDSTVGSTGTARPAWPGPTAASSVGQAAPDRERTSWAGPTVSGTGDRFSAESDQASRPIPTTSSSSIGADAPVGVATPGPASTQTSEDEIYRPGERLDPSVREDYAHADADRKAGGAFRAEADAATTEDESVKTADKVKTDDAVKTADGVVRTEDDAVKPVDPVRTEDEAVKTGNDSKTEDAVETTNTSKTEDVVKDHDDEADQNRTAPDPVSAVTPVTPISSGRRRSDAVPDAVAGNADLTSDTEWRELQAQFVDDPEATVSEAATLLERDLAGLRAKLAGGSTEDLRNAFKRYRGLHESLR